MSFDRLDQSPSLAKSSNSTALPLWLIRGMDAAQGSLLPDAYIEERKLAVQQIVLRVAEERSRRDTRGASR